MSRAATARRPTQAKQGLTGFEVMVRLGIHVPRGAPKDATDKFNATLRTTLKDPVVATRVAALDTDSCRMPSSRLKAWAAG